VSAVNKLVKAWREGTLVEKLASKFGRMPVTQRVRWLGARDAMVVSVPHRGQSAA
jgi:hypothetical protein